MKAELGKIQYSKKKNNEEISSVKEKGHFLKLLH